MSAEPRQGGCEGISVPPCGRSDAALLSPLDSRPRCALSMNHDGPCDWHPLFAIRDPLPYEAKRIFDEALRASAGKVPPEVLAAAVGWIKTGELCRSYGPAFIIAYSLKHAIESDALSVAFDDESQGSA